jgi:hypothetical protein
VKQVSVIVIGGPSSGDRFSFSLSEQGIEIGRLAECGLVLQDPKVSRKHARIFLQGRKVMLEDLGSSHGTLHMGFRLEPSAPRELGPGDEFKLGDSLFSIDYETEPAPVKAQEAPVKLPRKPVLFGGIGAILLLLLLLFSMDGGEEELPAQRSGERLMIPNRGTFGFVPGGDLSHGAKVRFELPTSDVVIEYDFMGTGNTDLLLDEVKIDSLPKTDGAFERRMLLVRDPLGGRERILTFDERGIDEVGGGLNKRPRPWGVRNIRYVSMPQDDGRTMSDKLNGALSYADELGRSNSSLYRLSRLLQSVGLSLLQEIGIEAQDVPIPLDSPRPSSELVKLRLEGILSERAKGVTSEQMVRHLKVLVDLISACEAELWRKFTVEMRQVRTASQTKDFIGAHDRLLGIQTMIGDEDDYRYLRAQELLDDKKIVPAKVRKNPGRFRKNAQ